MVGARAVYDELKAVRAHPDDVPAVAGSGVYALFAREADCLLPEIVLAEDGLLYIGESGDLRERDHFVTQHSGFSSPRRSLGVILKARLGLTAIPRASGPSETNVRNFRVRGRRGAAVERVDAEEPRIRGVPVQRRGTAARSGDRQGHVARR